MALHRVPFYTGATTDGAPQHPADLVRQVVNIAPGEGVGGWDHLVPRAEDGQLLIGFGLCVIQGRAQQWQGKYADWNQGDHVVDFTGNSTGSPRSDLIVVRVEDPNFEGSRNVMTDPVVFSEQITNVPAGTRTLTQAGKPGYSAIPVMRVDWPAGTTVPIQDYITDVRFPVIRNPYFQDSIQHGALETVRATIGGFVDWPASTVSVDVPTWATRVDIDCTVRTARFNENGPGETFNNIFGDLRLTIDGDVGGGQSGYNHEWPNGVSRGVVGHSGTFGVVPYQGTTVDLTLQVNMNGKNDTEIIEADNGTSVIWGVFFREETAFNP